MSTAPSTPMTDALLGAMAAERSQFDRLVDYARQLERDRAELLKALQKAISEADGWHDDSRAGRCEYLDPERDLLERMEAA